MSALLRCEGLSVAAGDRLLVERLDLELTAGELVAVLGTNGAGKTSLLETLAGLRSARAGRVVADGLDVHHGARPAIARRIGMMLQHIDEGLPGEVLAQAALGRHPHKGLWAGEDPDDLALARRALEEVDLDGFEARRSDTLSGGEHQRLALATLLVQAPAAMLLDEPLSHLDPYHQIEVGRLLRRRRDAGHGIVMSAHDMNLAARFADRVLLLYGDGRWALGATSDILSEASLEELYGVPIRRLRDGARDVYVPV